MREMAKIVKKTYGKKLSWEAGPSHAFDEAKLQSTKTNPSKLIRPSIWAKVPLIETFIAESPPRVKKRSISATKQDLPELEDRVIAPKKGKKRKIQDPFGFGDVDDEVLPASEYISPKRKTALEKPSGIKKSKAKKIKIGDKSVSNKDLFQNNNNGYGSPKHVRGNLGAEPVRANDLTNAASPKKRGRPPKNSPVSVMSPSKDKSVPMKTKGIVNSPSPKKRGRPPKHITQSPAREVKELSKPVTPGSADLDLSPKKRGRPPKNSIQSPKNKLSKVSKSLTPDKKSASPGQKKRGRPPKSQLSSPTSPVKLTKTSITKKKPELIQKMRGRSLKNIGLVSPKSGRKDEHSSPKKRGRLPKSPMSIPAYSSSSQNSSQSLKSEGTSGTPSPKKRGRPPKSKSRESPASSSNTLEPKKESHKNSSLASSNVSDLIDKNRISGLDSGVSKSPFSIYNVAQDKMTQENSSIVHSESVIQVIDAAPLIKKKRGRKPKANLTGCTGVSSPALYQEAAQLDESSYLSSSALSSEPLSSKENTNLDPDESIEQESSEEGSKKVRFSTDILQADDDNEFSSSKASTSSATGSPFKWFLKNNEKTLSPRKVAQLRRMSVLPTCTPQKCDDDNDDDDDNDGDLGAIPFSLTWAMQQDDNALRVNKDDKELFTIVRNTKQAQESVEFGESQQFKDDIEYLLDGISDTNSLSTRCLSLIELASKCSKSAFRMNLRAHGTINTIFQRLNDAPDFQTLALCTASVMFMLTRDRLSIDFDKSILDIMLKLLAMEEKDDEMSSKEWGRLTSKIRAIFKKNEVKGVNNLDLSKLTTESLARESLLSLTLQRTGSWFKDEIRLLGGLDHVVDTVVSCSKCLKVDGTAVATDSSTNVRQIERCLKLLENVTVQCPSNQGYLTSYRDSALLETCARLLMFSVASLIAGDCVNKAAVQALWFSTMKILLNLTHDNELASTRFCQKNNVLSILLKSALQLPNVLPSTKRFDVVVLSLGLLINLVEYSKKNLLALNAATAPPLLSSSDGENTASSEKDDTSVVESLMHLFMVKLEAAKSNSGMEEDLAKLNSSLHNSSIRIGSDGVSLVCGDDLDKSTANDTTEEDTAKEDISEKQETEDTAATEKPDEKANDKTPSENEAEHLGKALEKAGQHMEDSLIASYAALLLGLLCEDSKENQQIIHENLQFGDFGIMTHTLNKFLAFMNMTASSSSSSSSVVIKRAVSILEQCKSEYPTELPVAQMT